MSASFRDLPLHSRPVFDPARADETVAELTSAGSRAVRTAPFRALLAAAAGNSAYLARLMLRERGFLDALPDADIDAVVVELTGAALAVSAAPDAASAMRDLRIAKRRLALAVALADLAGLVGSPGTELEFAL